MKKIYIGLVSLISILQSSTCGFAEKKLDEAGQKLAEVILTYQVPSGLTPFSIEDNVSTGSDYTWGLWMMAIVAGERNGYIDHATALDKLSKMLNTIDKLEKYKGWLYWGYHLDTLKPDSDRLGFQGWYLYSLIVIKNVYPELAPLCEKFLGQVDYSVVYDKESRFLSDFNVTEQKRLWRIPLGPLADGSDMGHPASERRVAYNAYTYITGDKGPWLLDAEPNFQELEGLQFLSVWAHYNFDIAHLHYVLPEFGYYEKSWDAFLVASDKFIQREKLKFFPARSGTLEEGLWNPTSPNTEHRETMPWISWYLDKNAPVMDYAYKPGHGLFRYYDQWNFYWSVGETPAPYASIGAREGNANAADSSISVRFFVNTNPRFTRPPKLNEVWLVVSIPDEENPPSGNLEIYLNKQKIGEILPSELSSKPKKIVKKFDVEVSSYNNITFKNSSIDTRPTNRYDIYRYEMQVSPCEYSYQVPELNLKEGVHGYEFSPFAEHLSDPQFAGPAAGIIVEGQDIGPTVEDTCTAFLIRMGAVHNYYVWHDLLNDQKFIDSLVAWVGKYYSKVSLAKTIHNVGIAPVKVEYERPKEWKDAAQIRVTDEVTNQDLTHELEISDQLVKWQAEPFHTYKIEYRGGGQ
jgi:hypothetical protein